MSVRLEYPENGDNLTAHLYLDIFMKDGVAHPGVGIEERKFVISASSEDDTTRETWLNEPELNPEGGFDVTLGQEQIRVDVVLIAPIQEVLTDFFFEADLAETLAGI